jgi:mono/diheme cytochrome c family protein
MTKLLLVLSSMILFPLMPLPNPAANPARAAQDAAQAPAPTPTPTPPDTKNPVRATADSKAKAKKMYGYDCEMCHNANGDGKSDLAKDMNLTMTDLTDPKTLTGKSDGELFDIIKNGKGKMPPEDGSRAKPDDIWNLVIYVRGMAKN